jgi:hypothetical protein
MRSSERGKVVMKVKYICFDLYIHPLHYLFIYPDRIGGVMVSVLAWSAVDRGFEPRSDQTDY